MSAENRTNLTQTYILKIKELERSVAELEFGVSEAKKIAQENLEKMDVINKIFYLNFLPIKKKNYIMNIT